MNLEHLTTSLLAFYQRNVLDRPRRAILLVIAITIGMAFGLPHFKLDASADSLTLERDEDLNFFREISQRYGSDNFLLLTFSPKTVTYLIRPTCRHWPIFAMSLKMLKVLRIPFQCWMSRCYIVQKSAWAIWVKI